MKNVSPRYPTYVIHEGYDRELALQSVGDGWASLVNELFDFMEQQKINNVRIVQVNEKWGGLRVYTDMVHDKVDAKITELGKRSFSICEVSGEAGKLRNCNGWYRTLSEAEGGQYPVVTQS